jgi:NAD(P)H-hydrate epimerase
MAGAPALVANAAFRAGAGLVQLLVPPSIRETVITIAPCATARSLVDDADVIMHAIHSFQADVLAIGPGLGESIGSGVLREIVSRFAGIVVIDADGLNLLAKLGPVQFANSRRIILTPHAGEAARLLHSCNQRITLDSAPASRRAAACALTAAFGCSVVLKGSETLVTNGDRLYVNDTGNAGMATAGTGDLLTGVISALAGQKMDPFEASILGVYLHGLAGDFAAEELGRHSMTAQDLIEYLPDAFCEYENSTVEQN